jgi:hypothetical protein
MFWKICEGSEVRQRRVEKGRMRSVNGARDVHLACSTHKPIYKCFWRIAPYSIPENDIGCEFRSRQTSFQLVLAELM